ncbi:MAG: hypothetical protein ACK5LC_03325 [Coprobacillaceae bacterium]
MKKIKELLNTKTKKLVASGIGILVIVISSVGVYALTNNEKKELLKAVKEVVIEYGDEKYTEKSLKDDIKLFVDTKKLSDQEKSEVLKNTTINIDGLLIQEEKTYPKLGEYKVTLSYEDEKQESKIVVKDTIAPVFNETNEISLEQTEDHNAVLELLKTSVVAEDLQEVTYSYGIGDDVENLADINTIDFNVVGEYTMQVIAVDSSNNTSTKQISVIITEKIEEVVEENTETNNSNNSNGSNNNNGTSNNGTGNDTGNNNTSNNNNGSNNNGSGNNGSGSGGGTTETPHSHDYKSPELDWFTDRDTAVAKGNEFIFSTANKTGPKYTGFDVVYCSCGLIGILFK